ncbi:MAG: type II toxin-antitoxin system HicA family toxin [Planctomycetes bacterium]|nr:type II toxin-antitoxin system HicA family toxin [Planctomycetota bacterium]
MKMPRDLSGADLAKALKSLGYVITRQKSSHIRMTTQQNGEHHITIPDHDFIKVGTLAEILKDVAFHFDLTRDELLNLLMS